jgi:zinc/manganese transport system permease protein
VVTASVQLVGVYLVFTSLIVPAVATYRHAGNRQLTFGYALAFASYLTGLAASVITDLPSSPVIVWAMAILGLLVHLAGDRSVRTDIAVGVNQHVRTAAKT